MKRLAILLSLGIVLLTACGGNEEDKDAGTVNIEKGVAPEMWNPDTESPTGVDAASQMQEPILAEDEAMQPGDTPEPEKPVAAAAEEPADGEEE